MITIENVKDIAGQLQTLQIPSTETCHIDATGLTLFPGLIDPHVHFRTPGHEHKENWESAALSAIYGGMTCVFDMPNNQPACTTAERLAAKKELIDTQLNKVDIPLNYHLYFGADKNHFDQIPLVRDDIVAIKVFMGSSTGDLLISDDESLHQVFRIAAEQDLLIAVHAECDCMINDNAKALAGATDFKTHAQIRSPEVARVATENAINIAAEYGTRLIVLHISTEEEVALIARAKDKGQPVYGETSPHHLFLDDSAYATLGAKAQVNPPIREARHRKGILQGIVDGVIDTIGSDHAPHTLTEKGKPYGQAPSGMPGVETSLPLLLNAHHHGHLTLSKIADLTYHNINRIYRLDPRPHDAVLVDLTCERSVVGGKLHSKCGWSAYENIPLRGWPTHTILANRCFTLNGDK